MKTLISKLGAQGDVVRTTVLLSALEGEIHWLSRDCAKDLLGSKKISQRYFIEKKKDIRQLKNQKYDLVLSLEEEESVLQIISVLDKKKLVGVYLNENSEIDYTLESSYWFDMSLVSKLGKEKADFLKKQNTLSVPRILYEMIGKKYVGQNYDLGIEKQNISGVVGIIDICMGVWPNKFWKGYNGLKEELIKEGYFVKPLGMKPTIKQHIDDINNCELVVCGDTLGMHIALGLEKKVVALFNCTPPKEIEDFPNLKKIVSPLYERYFFSRTFSEEAVSAISIEKVYLEVKNLLNA